MSKSPELRYATKDDIFRGFSDAQIEELFRNMTIIQGMFAGVVIGKMAEGTMLAGVKHSLIMVTIGIAAFVLFL